MEPKKGQDRSKGKQQAKKPKSLAPELLNVEDDSEQQGIQAITEQLQTLERAKGAQCSSAAVSRSQRVMKASSRAVFQKEVLVHLSVLGQGAGQGVDGAMLKLGNSGDQEGSSSLQEASADYRAVTVVLAHLDAEC